MRTRFFNVFKFLNSKNRECASFSLLRNVITRLHLKFLPQLRKTIKTSHFVDDWRPTLLQWLTYTSSSANQIAAFALVYQQSSTNKQLDYELEIRAHNVIVKQDCVEFQIQIIMWFVLIAATKSDSQGAGVRFANSVTIICQK